MAAVHANVYCLANTVYEILRGSMNPKANGYNSNQNEPFQIQLQNIALNQRNDLTIEISTKSVNPARAAVHARMYCLATTKQLKTILNKIRGNK